MTATRPIKADIAADYARRFPDHGSLTLAKLIYKDHGALFNTIEHARFAVRHVRGARGTKKRHLKRINKPHGKHTDPFSVAIPEGIRHFQEREPLFIEGPARVGVLSDIHLPYHERGQLLEALRSCRDYAPSHLILNGDIADFFSVSFWEKDPRKRDLSNEIKTVREFLAVVRKQFPKTEIIYKLGNHEERWERYLRVKAPELIGVADFEIDKVLHFGNYGIQKVSDCRVIRIGHLNVVHGHEFKWGITDPVNPARGFYNRGKECCIGGHLHRTSSHNEKSMNGIVVSCWSTGCLCDLQPDYAPINKWNHGFATVELDKGGMFEVHNYKLINGRAFES